RMALASRHHRLRRLAQNRPTAKLARSRNRAPIGGRLGLDPDPAACRAGQMKADRVRWAVNRMAWVIGRLCRTAAWTWAKFSRPGRIGRPAASAEVHPAGRSAFEVRCQIAPEPAVEWPAR